MGSGRRGLLKWVAMRILALCRLFDSTLLFAALAASSASLCFMRRRRLRKILCRRCPIGRCPVRRRINRWRRRRTFTGRVRISMRRSEFSMANRTLAARWCRAARATTPRPGSTPSTPPATTSGTRATSSAFCGSECRATFRWPPISTSPIPRATATARSCS